MKYSPFRRAALLTLLAMALSHPAAAGDSFTDWSALTGKLLVSVVNIANIHYDPLGPGEILPGHRESLGSGFIIDASGIIATNKHVVEGADQITVTTSDNITYVATLLHEATLADVALLKIDANGPLPVVSFGDSDTLRQGDPVLAIGNPLGFGSSVSAGIVSALDRDIQSGPYDSFIQTDAAINHGNSGGALFDRSGKLIGMNTAIYTTSDTGGSIGIGFSIPSNDVKFVTSRLLEYGWVRTGWIGLDSQAITPLIAAGLGLPQNTGVIVTRVDATGPAARAGIVEGDTVLEVAGLGVHSVRGLNRAVGIQTIGGSSVVKLWHEGAPAILTVAIGDSPAESKAEMGKPMLLMPVPRKAALDMSLGLSLGPVGPQIKAKLKLLPKDNGIAVTAVTPNSTAANSGVLPGDIILQVLNQKVANATELRQLVTTAWTKPNSPPLLVLVVGSDSIRRWVALPVGK